MNAFQISWKNLKANPLTLALNLLLIAFGTGILAMLLVGMGQVADRLRNNAKGVDLVVGAKGSPLQLILSSIYFIDFPTGNISEQEARSLVANPMVKKAVPLALGDNYAGFRIVGTDTGYATLQGLELAAGRFWAKEFEIVIGAHVARAQHLKTGDRIYGSHGLSSDQDIHEDHPYIVTGILKMRGNVADDLVLTSLESIWAMHGADGKREVTSMLLQYRSRMAMVALPAMINRSTNMQPISAQDVIYMHEQGVSEQVIQAMLTPGAADTRAEVAQAMPRHIYIVRDPYWPYYYPYPRYGYVYSYGYPCY